MICQSSNARVIEIEAQSESATEMRRLDIEGKSEDPENINQLWFSAMCNGEIDVVRSMLLKGDVSVDTLDEVFDFIFCKQKGDVDFCKF